MLDFASDSGCDEDLQARLQHHFAKLFKPLAANGTNLFFQLVSARTEETALGTCRTGKTRIFPISSAYGLSLHASKIGAKTRVGSLREEPKRR